MVYFILGRSGSGKTQYIYNKINELVKQGIEPILIFPEQSSYMNEVRILKEYGSAVASKLPIQSFTRLAQTVLSENSEGDKKHLDESSKAILMSLAIESVKDHLELFVNRCDKKDLAALFMQVITDYKVSAATPQDILDKMKEINDERLRKKLKEIALIYQAYESVISQSFLDPDDELTRMYNRLLQSNSFQDKIVIIDSFSGFTYQELKILECIFGGAKDIYLTLGLDPLQTTKNADDVFATTQNTLNRLQNLCKNHSIPYKTISLPLSYRYVSQNLKVIESSLYTTGERDRISSDNTVSLFKADDIYAEGEQLARQISKLVYEKKYTYTDIVVVCRNIGTYAPILEPIFSKYNIPYFLSYPQRLECKPLMRLILSAFDVVLSSFDTESILVYLKTGLTNLKDSEIETLENYVYMWNIRGKQWKSEFTMSPDGNALLKTKTDEENQTEKIEKMEKLRQKVIEPLEKFSKALKAAKDGAAMAKAVYILLDDIKAATKMRILIHKLNKFNRTTLVEEETRLWDLMMQILDSLYNTTKDHAMTPRRFADLLKLALSVNTISDIPLTLDHVTVGAADRIRMDNPKAVFILGAIEDIFPALPPTNNFYTETERTELQKAEILRSDTFEELCAKEKYFAYMAVTGATDRLYISWYTQNSKGEQVKASSIVSEIKKIIPNLKPLTEAEIPLDDRFWSLRQSKEVAASLWQSNNTDAYTIQQYFKSQPETVSFSVSLDTILFHKPYVIKSKENAKKLFSSNSENLQLSASKIESYFSCPFKFFCQYGLKAKPREKADMDPRLFGNTVHFVLEKIISERGMDFLLQANEDEIDELIKTYLQNYLILLGGEQIHTERFNRLIKRIEKPLSIIIHNLIAEFSQSQFRPVDFELSIGIDKTSSVSIESKSSETFLQKDEATQLLPYILKLPTGETIQINGKIDRVDTFVKDNQKYIRIIDYKTGNKIFNLAEVMHGLNMQMLLYLSALRSLGYERYSENGQYDLIPAGVLYMPSSVKYEKVNNLSEFENSTTDVLLQKHQSGLKMNGLLIDDPVVLDAMERGCKGVFIPVKQKKGSSEFDYNSQRSLASLERFGKIFDYIDSKIIHMVSRLYEGRINAAPAKGKIDACQYCPYQAVCGYEEGQSCHVVASKMSREDIDRLLYEISEEEKHNG